MKQKIDQLQEENEKLSAKLSILQTSDSEQKKELEFKDKKIVLLEANVQEQLQNNLKFNSQIEEMKTLNLKFVDKCEELKNTI